MFGKRIGEGDIRKLVCERGSNVLSIWRCVSYFDLYRVSILVLGVGCYNGIGNLSGLF